MKRCPQCNRVETDDKLVFCRVDGARLVSESASLSSEPGTARLSSSSPASDEIETSILPHTTDAAISRGTGPTTVLPAQPPVTTGALAKPKRGIVIATVVIVTAVVAAVTALVLNSYLSRKSHASIQSIAVMPFVNESGNQEVEYLSDGMTETLIFSLSRLPNLSVKARSSVFSYKGKEITPQTIGKELSVQAVLNGRAMQRGDNLTLSLELVDARTGNLIWGEQYNRKMTELVSLQSEIARDVSSKLRAKLTGAEQQKVAKSHTQDTEAYQLYLQGRFYWNKRTREGTKKAIEYFQTAIEKDPNYALAYVGLAESYITSGSPDGKAKAKTVALKALALDETLGEAHATLAVVKGNSPEWNFAESEKEYKLAIQLSPNYSTARHWYAEHLVAMGRFDESFVEYNRALELDPLSLAISTDLGIAYYYARQYDHAIEHLKKLIEMDPNFVRTHLYLARVYEEKGMFTEALAELERWYALRGENMQAFAKDKARLEDALRISGAKGYWQTILDLHREEMQGIFYSDSLALQRSKLYAHLAERDAAIGWLEKAYAEGDDGLFWLKVSPAWDNLRSDPRFVALLRRVGFTH
jgi:TolB-like protein